MTAKKAKPPIVETEEDTEDLSDTMLGLISEHIASHADENEGLQCAGAILQDVIAGFMEMCGHDVGIIYLLAARLHEAVAVSAMEALDSQHEVEARDVPILPPGVH